MIVYDNRTSLSDNESSDRGSDGSPAGCVQKDKESENG